ncbi:DUF4190 domain-containing protein [Streptomyces meridianus]|uniref:DUF4190 domain-containing protein n=1 Tax=Streptomyces meridianus TaxID=2938945 RepID=A0ABT0X8M9_9ACTN|nr:DUF4190 domain-containing protein [Streptomyces meridianus]MCM2578889.1 DUF4190 domain-containing protein [Streptomyces meridianus]
MSDSAQQPERPGKQASWAPPEPRDGGISLGKSGEPDKRAASAGADAAAASGGADPGPSAAVPPPPVAPTGPYDPVGHAPGPYGAQPPGPYAPAGYGNPYGVTPGHGYGHQVPAAHGYGYGYGMPVPRPSNGLGVAALVLGIVGSVLFFTTLLAAILGVLAVIFGIVGRIRASKGEATNGGQALAGLILGIVAILVSLGFLTAVIVAAESEDEPAADSGSYSLVLTEDAGRRH